MLGEPIPPLDVELAPGKPANEPGNGPLGSIARAADAAARVRRLVQLPRRGGHHRARQPADLGHPHAAAMAKRADAKGTPVNRDVTAPPQAAPTQYRTGAHDDHRQGPRAAGTASGRNRCQRRNDEPDRQPDAQQRPRGSDRGAWRWSQAGPCGLGPARGGPVLLAGTWPGWRLRCPDLPATLAAGVRLVTADRPGAGRWDPDPHPGTAQRLPAATLVDHLLAIPLRGDGLGALVLARGRRR
jgi:hypothetical protein